MANFNKMICKRRRVTIASRRAHRVVTTDDDNSGQFRPPSMLALTCGDSFNVSDKFVGILAGVRFGALADMAA
jgi:hypothetical protein